MAWRFRKSVKLGPLRLNLSKSGVGYSIGGRGFRIGKDAKGRSYTAASIPGTGLYERKYSSQGKAADESAAGVPGSGARQSSGMGLAVGMLAAAFVAGGLVVYMLMPKPAPLPVAPPVEVSAPVTPPAPVKPAKKRRRAHGSGRASAPGVRHRSASPASHTLQTPPHPTSDAPQPAS